MRFSSPFTLFDVGVLKERIVRHPTTGDIIEIIPAVRAVFGVPGEEFTYTDPDSGRTERGANITGGMFDTLEYQKQTECSDEIREAIERRLLRQAETWPQSCQLVSKLKAALPWPTYDAVDAAKVPELAETLGLVGEALAYESENKNRKGVIAKLNEAAEKAVETVPEELTVA